MPSQRTLLVTFYCCTLFYQTSTAARTPCSCNLRGRLYNLGPLASSDGFPRFEKDMNGRNFAYNPCIPFTVKAPCKNVAICRWNNEQTTYAALGLQQNVQCQLEQEQNELVFQVPNNPSDEKTRVRLKCNPKRDGLHDALFSVIDDNDHSTILEVEHNCCCPDACPLGKPLATVEKTDIGKWVAVGISGLLGLCIICGIIVYVVLWYRRRRMQAPDNEPLQEQRNARPIEN